MISLQKGAVLGLVLLVASASSCYGQFSGSLTPDYRGGNDLNFKVHQSFGNARENVAGSFGLNANSKGGPATGNLGLNYNRGLNSAGVFGSHTPGAQTSYGAGGNLNLFNGNKDRLDVFGSASKTRFPTHEVNKFGTGLNFNDHSASFSQNKIPGVGTQNRFDASANLFNSGTNRFDANAFKSNTKFNNGQPSVGSHGGGLSWNNAGGHGASFGFDRTPALKETNVFAKGNANVWRSQNGMTSLDAFGGVSKTLSGPNRNRPNVEAGFGLSHRF